jgi:ABC-type branched-subunit amino acid transport system substrate-binding protein
LRTLLKNALGKEAVMKKAMAIGMIVVLLEVLGVALSYGANSIKVGFVDTYSGPASVYCFDVVDGFKMAIQTINAKGGVYIRLGTSSLIPILASPWRRNWS